MVATAKFNGPFSTTGLIYFIEIICNQIRWKIYVPIFFCSKLPKNRFLTTFWTFLGKTKKSIFLVGIFSFSTTIFLSKYCFFELIGPTGHYETSEMALYVNFLDQNAYYPWHNHEAEELYFIVSGKAKFECKDQNIEILSSTKTRLHKSFQPHAITTIENQVLSFVIWKNKFENISKMIKG